MKFKTTLVMLAAMGALQVGSAYAEHEAGHKGMFKTADANADGKVSFDEFKAEHEKRMAEMFKKMDANGDGFIDEAEHKAAHGKMREHRKDRHKKDD